MQVGTGVNGLGLRLFDPEGLQHRVLVPVLRIRSQLDHGQVVGHGAAYPELNLLARGYAFLGIGMQAGQVDRVMRWNLRSLVLGYAKAGEEKKTVDPQSI